MGSKIKRITILGAQGSEEYRVGTVYSNLLLDKIRDNSIDTENYMVVRYDGITVDGDLVFEVINAPIDVAYEKA